MTNQKYLVRWGSEPKCCQCEYGVDLGEPDTLINEKTGDCWCNDRCLQNDNDYRRCEAMADAEDESVQ